MSTGGSEYDGRLVGEARELVDVAYKSYPEIANNRSKFLIDQLYSISQQQADKDFKVAEFYRRIGKPGPAYFMYEVVRRRYPGTQYAQKATERMHELGQHGNQEDPRRAAPAPVPGVRMPGPETGPRPRTFTPGSPLETGPAPQPLPPSLTGDRPR
jgi:hypothetical protein